ncbi:kynureninase [Deinococcus metallilatus]|uniref:Kynureninase n=1 Tax=Deinococcus metallilatus TaxID=1211322 RepID=A0AAJ5JYZ7_9DEIO|nr:kynureninase [Deinococcus metallilatus]MBB5294889.1 kynureninase [Deinococcus metallilatus]QBY09398.1 kynureninase [Deinococcus metallilatus]RXJ09404.1 kynureninase [Deinococcus metallilatus]TLK28926.1 kynureninase [Deinococcus metallilatus]GMA16818.1 kynureninase [Deinococcus metallilatus]
MRRDLFAMPPGIYLDGNSLGVMPFAAREAVLRRLDEWQTEAVSGWDAWFGLAESLSPSIARLVGALPQEVIATGSITANLHALLATLYRPEGARRHLVATSLDFPSDVYALQAWADREGAELRLIPSRDGHTLHQEDILAALADDVALVLLPTVLYRSGQLLDVPGLTREAHSRGLLIGWDAAHSVGSVPHDLHGARADFAVWCHYKYVNAGPGAPGGLYLHERHHHLTPGLRGWWGHDKGTQFEMAHAFRKAPGAGAYQLGTPPVLALAALEGALGVFDTVEMEEVRARSLDLTSHLMALADEHLPEMRIVTPREPARRGGHVALAHPEAHALSLALRQRGITPDFRQPDILRLAPVALYNTAAEVEQTVRVLRELLDTGAHRAVEAAGLVT